MAEKKKQDWKDVEFADVLSMSTNVVNPGRKYGRRILNAHTHVKPGALKGRPRYSLKYEKPSDPTIENLGYPNFDCFFDKQAEPEGKEITCLVQSGELMSIDNAGLPIVEDTQRMLFFLIRPYFN